MIDQNTQHTASLATTSSPRLPISCYIRTLNEARRIGDVLHAAKQIADEVILIDCGSTDGTIEIAERCGARVIHQEWLGNGFQKRIGEDFARHDWLLDLDADEVVTPELAAAIRRVFNGVPQYSVYEFPLITVPPYGRPWNSFKIAWRRKLYNRTILRIPDSAVWDQFEVPSGMRIGRINNPLLHYSFSSIEHLVTKLNKVSSTRAREAKLKSFPGVVLRVLFGLPGYFIKEYFARGLILAGIYGFSIALSLAFARWMRDAKMYERHLQSRKHLKQQLKP